MKLQDRRDALPDGKKMGFGSTMAFHTWSGKCNAVCETASLLVHSHARVSLDTAQKGRHLFK